MDQIGQVLTIQANTHDGGTIDHYNLVFSELKLKKIVQRSWWELNI